MAYKKKYIYAPPTVGMQMFLIKFANDSRKKKKVKHYNIFLTINTHEILFIFLFQEHYYNLTGQIKTGRLFNCYKNAVTKLRKYNQFPREKQQNKKLRIEPPPPTPTTSNSILYF